MFVTHLTMAIQHIQTDQQEGLTDSQVLETIKMGVAYPRAETFPGKMSLVYSVEFPQTKQDFLEVHLCNLFT